MGPLWIIVILVTEERSSRTGVQFLERDPAPELWGFHAIFRKHQPIFSMTSDVGYNSVNGRPCFIPRLPHFTLIEMGGSCRVLKRGMTQYDLNLPWPLGEQG